MKNTPKTILFLVGLFFASLCSFCFSDFSHGIAKESTVSLSVSDSNLSIEILPSISGQFGKSGDNTITASTDNYTGYSLYVATAISTSGAMAYALSKDSDSSGDE